MKAGVLHKRNKLVGNKIYSPDDYDGDDDYDKNC